MISVLNDDILKKLKPRPDDSHKGCFGSLLCVAGSATYRGAAALAVSAALRSGTGLVTLASTEKVVAAASVLCAECVLLPLPEGESGEISEKALPLIIKAAEKASALVFGPGLSDSPAASSLLCGLLLSADCPVLIDADGINALTKNIDILKQRKQKGAVTLLTPHPGEMARIVRKPVNDVVQNAAEIARSFAETHGVTVVLKGAVTHIACEGFACQNNAPNSGLSVGGSGDVLAGIIGALLAAGETPETAASAGVRLHSLCAAVCAEKLSKTAMLPTDLVSSLPEIFLMLKR